jgi:hypothetical protein
MLSPTVGFRATLVGAVEYLSVGPVRAVMVGWSVVWRMVLWLLV